MDQDADCFHSFSQRNEYFCFQLSTALGAVYYSHRSEWLKLLIAVTFSSFLIVKDTIKQTRHLAQTIIPQPSKGMEAERPRKQGKRFLNGTSIQPRLRGPILLLSVSNSAQVWQLLFCRGIFWLHWIAQGCFLCLNRLLICCMSAISRNWMCRGWGFIIFDERNLFLSHRYNFGTCGNRISTRFCFVSIFAAQHKSMYFGSVLARVFHYPWSIFLFFCTEVYILQISR